MMNGITVAVVVISMVMMFLVSRMLRRSIYIEKIIKGFALILTVVSTLAIVKCSFYSVFNLCERVSTGDGVFVFIIGGSMAVTLLFLAYCWVGQIAAKREITF